MKLDGDDPELKTGEAAPVSENPGILGMSDRGNESLLDASQAAAVLNVPHTWVLAEARCDRIPHIRLGRYVRFDREELLHWARTQRRGPSFMGGHGGAQRRRRHSRRS